MLTATSLDITCSTCYVMIATEITTVGTRNMPEAIRRRTRLFITYVTNAIDRRRDLNTPHNRKVSFSHLVPALPAIPHRGLLGALPQTGASLQLAEASQIVGVRLQPSPLPAGAGRALFHLSKFASSQCSFSRFHCAPVNTKTLTYRPDRVEPKSPPKRRYIPDYIGAFNYLRFFTKIFEVLEIVFVRVEIRRSKES